MAFCSRVATLGRKGGKVHQFFVLFCFWFLILLFFFLFFLSSFLLAFFILLKSDSKSPLSISVQFLWLSVCWVLGHILGSYEEMRKKITDSLICDVKKKKKVPKLQDLLATCQCLMLKGVSFFPTSG